jgi:hypothetical protein
MSSTYIPAALRRLVEDRAQSLTAIRRTTVSLLKLNSPEKLAERQKLISLDSND